MPDSIAPSSIHLHFHSHSLPLCLPLSNQTHLPPPWQPRDLSPVIGLLLRGIHAFVNLESSIHDATTVKLHNGHPSPLPHVGFQNVTDDTISTSHFECITSHLRNGQNFSFPFC